MSRSCAPNNWIAVACAAHVRRGREGGFMQVCHGKHAPLRRIRPGDRVVYYAPTETLGGRDLVQAFVAYGWAGEGAPYQVAMSANFHPFRRDVAWAAARPASIHPLLPRLSFTAGVKSWGAPFRFGLFAIPDVDMDLIAAAMTVDAAPELTEPPPAPRQLSLFGVE